MRGSPTAELFFDNVEIPDGMPYGPAYELTIRERPRESRRRSCGVDVGIRSRETGSQRWTSRVCTCPSGFWIGCAVIQ